jgi:hypothetical protein
MYFWIIVLRIFFGLFSPRWRGCSNVTFSSQLPQHYCHFLVLVHVLQDLVHHRLAVGSSAPASFSYLRLTPKHVESNSLSSWCKLVCWLQQALPTTLLLANPWPGPADTALPSPACPPGSWLPWLPQAGRWVKPGQLVPGQLDSGFSFVQLNLNLWIKTFRNIYVL